MTSPRVCDFDGCAKPHEAGGLCDGHYKQRRRGRDLTPLGGAKPVVQRPTTRWWTEATCFASGVSFETLTDEVAELCAACPVRSECLDSALAEEAGEDDVTRHLIRGGKTPLDRYRIAVEQGSAGALVNRVSLDEGSACIDCGAIQVSQKIWRFAEPEQRRQWVSDGYARSGGFGRCTRDYKRYKRLDPEHVAAESAYKNRARAARRAAAKAA